MKSMAPSSMLLRAVRSGKGQSRHMQRTECPRMGAPGAQAWKPGRNNGTWRHMDRRARVHKPRRIAGDGGGGGGGCEGGRINVLHVHIPRPMPPPPTGTAALCAHPPDDALLPRVAGHHDDGQVAQVWPPSYVLQQLQPVHARHVHVDEGEVKVAGVEQLQRAQRVAGRCHDVPHPLQRVLQHFPVRLGVVHHHDIVGGRVHVRAGGREQHFTATTIGAAARVPVHTTTGPTAPEPCACGAGAARHRRRRAHTMSRLAAWLGATISSHRCRWPGQHGDG